MDCVVEAFRVLGNLSRAKRIRDILMKCKGEQFVLFSNWFFHINLVDRLAIHHCQSDNIELLYAVIGVLINLTVDEDKRECLKIHNGIDRWILYQNIYIDKFSFLFQFVKYFWIFNSIRLAIIKVISSSRRKDCS